MWHFGADDGLGGPPTADVSIELWGVDSEGLPDANNILAARTATPAEGSIEIPTFTYLAFDFSTDAIELAVGDQLAIVARSDTNPGLEGWNWTGAFPVPDPYPGGELLLNVNGAGWEYPSASDAGFRVTVIAAETCAGDLADPADGVVDFNDLLALFGQWGPCAAPCAGDLADPPDGVVDFNDLLALFGLWGPCSP